MSKVKDSAKVNGATSVPNASPSTTVDPKLVSALLKAKVSTIAPTASLRIAKLQEASADSFLIDAMESRSSALLQIQTIETAIANAEVENLTLAQQTLAGLRSSLRGIQTRIDNLKRASVLADVKTEIAEIRQTASQEKFKGKIGDIVNKGGSPKELAEEAQRCIDKGIAELKDLGGFWA